MLDPEHTSKEIQILEHTSLRPSNTKNCVLQKAEEAKRGKHHVLLTALQPYTMAGCQWEARLFPLPVQVGVQGSESPAMDRKLYTDGHETGAVG